MRIVVLGVGNVLYTDEGVGVCAVNEIARRYELPPEVELIDGGTSGMELLDALAGADRLVIIDAVASGAVPGAIVRLEGDAVPRFFTTKLSPHQVGLCDVLAALSLMEESPAETVIVGVEPASLEMSMKLSPTVAAKLPAVLDVVMDELRRHGVAPRPRLPAAAAA